MGDFYWRKNVEKADGPSSCHFILSVSFHGDIQVTMKIESRSFYTICTYKQRLAWEIPAFFNFQFEDFPLGKTIDYSFRENVIEKTHGIPVNPQCS